MTAFGKILVFMNLLFSVVTGFMIIMVFDKRTDWKTKYDKMERRAESAEVAFRNEKQSHDNDLKQKDSATTSKETEIASLKERLIAAQADAQANLKKAQEQEKINSGASTDSQKIQAEMAQIREERQRLIDEKQVLRASLVNVQKEVDAQRLSYVNADLQAKALLSKNSNLLKQLEELTVKLRDMEQAGTQLATGVPGTNSVLNPPPKAAPPGVRGRITSIGREGSNLAQINVGSDSGVSAGNVLIVYRGDVYVGDLTVTGTEPKIAVGKFVPAKRNMTVQVNDAVITSFSSVSQ